MGSLRDELFKAGLVDRKAKQKADTEVRRKKKKKKKKKGAPEEELARKKAYDEEMARRAEENRAREEARKAEQERKEQANRVANLVRAWAMRRSGKAKHRWYFLVDDKRIGWLDVTAELAWKLEMGAVAIVANPMDADEPFAIVPRNAADKIVEIDDQAVRFWNRSGRPQGDRDRESRQGDGETST